MTDCIHGLHRPTCATCAHRDEPVVYVSSGGTVFHQRRDCPALVRGQDIVAERGGQLGDVKRVPLRSAERDGRRACRTCRGA